MQEGMRIGESVGVEVIRASKPFYLNFWFWFITIMLLFGLVLIILIKKRRSKNEKEDNTGYITLDIDSSDIDQ
jgi:heme/copper-type cytochrome/quinol oxidase subunit 2